MALAAHPSLLERGMICTSFAMTRHFPRLLVTIRKADEIEPAMRRFGQAVALLWPSASFCIYASHQKRPWGSPHAEAGRKVPRMDDAIQGLSRLRSQWVRGDQAMQGSRLEDEPLHVAMPDGTIGDEASMVQTIAFTIRADLMARRLKSAA
ncbi:MAG: hypothetical protein ACK5VI_09350 [Opitutia bacterium]